MKIISNLRRTHSEEEDEEKGERGYQGLLFVAQQPSPPLPPPPHTRTVRLLNCLGLRYQDTSPPNSTFTQAKISDFQEKRLKSMTASF